MYYFFGLFFLLAASLEALYYGSPNLPQATLKGALLTNQDFVGIKIGYLGDVVLGKSLETTNSLKLKKMQVFRSHTQQGVFAVNFMDRFEAYGSLGAMKMHLEPKVAKYIRETFETHESLTWGFGARGVLYSFTKACLGLDFKYQGYHPGVQWGSINGVSVNVSQDAKLSYDEWQIGLGVSYDCAFMTPYFGAIYNRVEGKLCNLFVWKEHYTFKSRKKFGAACGVCFCSQEYFELDVEARVINETAFSINGNFRF